MITTPNILPRDGRLHLIKDAFSLDNADSLFSALSQTIHFRAETATIFGKRIAVPRLVAWYGEKPYAYSGIIHQPQPWTLELEQVREVVEHLTATKFNSALLNLYRDGHDSMGWHADNESVLGPQPIIASVSLGTERKFQVKHRRDPELRVNLILPHGSCLIMAGAMQQHWVHQVPKTVRPVGPRLNLTYRSVF